MRLRLILGLLVLAVVLLSYTPKLWRKLPVHGTEAVARPVRANADPIRAQDHSAIPSRTQPPIRSTDPEGHPQIGREVAGGRESTVTSEALPLILGHSGDKRLSARRSAVNRLGTEMKPEDVLALCSYLREGCRTDDSLNPDQKYVLVNEIQDVLQEQKEPPPDFTETLLAVYRDRTQDEVIRDYTVQHLGTWYERAPDKRPIRDALWEATGETQSSVAGTALLALSNISDSDRDRLAQTALQIAMDEQSGVAARITALQICAQLGVREAAPIARELAQLASPVSLRVSAIATLGALGDGNDSAFLQRLAEGTDLRVQPAARVALKRLPRQLRRQE
jgi:hypothetical protein